MSPFNNDIIGGTKLLVPAIRSPNFIAGVQGWSINKDGTVEFGSGTFRGPVVVIDPVTQAVLASIGATGNIAGQTLSAANDILLGNTSLADYLFGAGRGLIARKALSGALPSTGNSVFVDTAWIEFQAVLNRHYLISTTPIEIVNPGGPAGTDQVRMRLNMASSDGGFAGTVLDSRMDVDEQVTITPMASFRATATATQRVQLALLGQGVVMTVPNPSNSFKFFVIDIGFDDAVSFTGGSGTATGAETFTKQYVCTGSRSYDTNGNPIGSPDQDNNVYRGDFPDRTFGNERSYLIFPNSSIRSDLTGATVNYARIYFYCFKSEDTAGSIGLSSEASGTLPATYNAGVGTDLSESNVWPVPGWAYVSIVGSLLNEILAGDNGIGMAPTILGTGATGFRGFGFSTTFRPYIEIKYTK
jgi:hypothetical protein